MATSEQVRQALRRQNRPAAESTVRAGAIAGLIAGIFMALGAMGHSASAGLGFWTPMKVIAATWLGVDALVGGGGAVFLGMITHLVAASFWGAVFASLIWRRESVGAAFWEGLVFGVAVWLIMTYIGLPIFDTTMIPRVAMSPDWWFYDHLIYGACLCLTPAIRRALSPVAPGYIERPRSRQTTAA